MTIDIPYYHPVEYYLKRARAKKGKPLTASEKQRIRLLNKLAKAHLTKLAKENAAWSRKATKR